MLLAVIELKRGVYSYDPQCDNTIITDKAICPCRLYASGQYLYCVITQDREFDIYSPTAWPYFQFATTVYIKLNATISIYGQEPRKMGEDGEHCVCVLK